MAADFDRLMSVLADIRDVLHSINNSLPLQIQVQENPATRETLNRILETEETMAGELERLVAAVADVNGKADSLITLTNGLAQFIRDHVGNQAALLQMATELEAQSGEIQAAIDANPLPTDPPPTP